MLSFKIFWINGDSFNKNFLRIISFKLCNVDIIAVVLKWGGIYTSKILLNKKRLENKPCFDHRIIIFSVEITNADQKKSFHLTFGGKSIR